jgi:hypothetical protein
MATSGAGFGLTVLPVYTPVLRPAAYTGIGGALRDGIQAAREASQAVNELALAPRERRLRQLQLDEEINITPKKYGVAQKKLDLEGAMADTELELEPMRKASKAQAYDLNALQAKQAADAIRAVPGLETAVRAAKEDQAKFIERELVQENPDGTIVKAVQKYDRITGEPVGPMVELSKIDEQARQMARIYATEQAKAAAKSALNAASSGESPAPGSPVIDPVTGGPTGYLYGKNGQLVKDIRTPTPATIAKIKDDISKMREAEVTTDQTLALLDDLLSPENESARKSVTGTVRLGNIPLIATRGKDYLLKLETLKAKLFREGIQAMRGMGALSNAEGEKVQASIAALDPAKMTEDGFVEALKKVQRDIAQLKETAKKELAEKMKAAGADNAGEDWMGEGGTDVAGSSGAPSTAAIVPPSQDSSYQATLQAILGNAP